MTASPKAFLFDANLCTGCQACELACTIENELDAVSWRRVETFNEARTPGIPMIHLSLACNHCEDPPCAAACPALAYTKDAATGLVRLDAEKCIGCKYCSWACPYDAPRFDDNHGVMTKCTFCEHRQREGLAPACVTQCPTGALGWGELEALPGEIEGLGMPTVEPGPSIRFVPWRGGSVTDSLTLSEMSPETDIEAPPERPSKITLRSEWPLVGFTLLAAGLVAAVTAAAFGQLAPHLLAFLLPLALSFILSSLHLGRKERAWRAVLNLRRSWLSREIAAYGAFAGLATVGLVVPGGEKLLGVAAGVGFLALFCMDRVYDIVLRHEPNRLHSADVFLTGALAAALLLGQRRVVLVLLLAKLVLYVLRKRRFHCRGDDPRLLWSARRIGGGLLLPAAALLAGIPHASAFALAAVALGELIDRAELYTELRVPTPLRELDRQVTDRQVTDHRDSDESRPVAPSA